MLYQNDDFGKDLLHGLEDGLGDKAKTMIVEHARTYEATDPTVDSQLIHAQGLRRRHALPDSPTPSWRRRRSQARRPRLEAAHLPGNLGAASVGVDLQAGRPRQRPRASSAAAFLKDVTDPQWANDDDVKEWMAWMKE